MAPVFSVRTLLGTLPLALWSVCDARAADAQPASAPRAGSARPAQRTEMQLAFHLGASWSL